MPPSKSPQPTRASPRWAARAAAARRRSSPCSSAATQRNGPRWSGVPALASTDGFRQVVAGEGCYSFLAVSMTHPPIEEASEAQHVPLIKRLGPGLITGAADDDPSGIATYSQAGAQYGYGLLWSVL